MRGPGVRHLSSPCNGEGDREAVEGLATAEPSGPSVTSPSAPRHLPMKWGGEALRYSSSAALARLKMSSNISAVSRRVFVFSREQW